jgi:hypothetical protein
MPPPSNLHKFYSRINCGYGFFVCPHPIYQIIYARRDINYFLARAGYARTSDTPRASRAGPREYRRFSLRSTGGRAAAPGSPHAARREELRRRLAAAGATLEIGEANFFGALFMIPG